jgi:hypothetical protein
MRRDRPFAVDETTGISRSLEARTNKCRECGNQPGRRYEHIWSHDVQSLGLDQMSARTGGAAVADHLDDD